VLNVASRFPLLYTHIQGETDDQAAFWIALSH